MCFTTMKENNNGFSLVELIIVIAIMAILVGVVGTQVVPYIEKSRQAKDLQVFSGWNTAGMSSYSMNADKLDPSADYLIVIKNGSVSCADPSLKGASALISTFCDLSQLKESCSSNNQISSQMSSKNGKEINAVKITIPVFDGELRTVITRLYLDESMNNESAAFGCIENQ